MSAKKLMRQPKMVSDARRMGLPKKQPIPSEVFPNIMREIPKHCMECLSTICAVCPEMKWIHPKNLAYRMAGARVSYCGRSFWEGTESFQRLLQPEDWR